MVNPYFIEMQMRLRQEEIERTVREARAPSRVAAPSIGLRLRAGSALVRFGLFLNGRAYRCPEALTQR
jgi:hypothetical protein